MKIVQGDQVQPEPAVRHRGGSLQARILLEGTPGTAGNFQLSLGITGSDFISPRHRHNFEQYRVVLNGEFDFGRDGKMTPGMVAYFPEGVYYGPQSSADDTVAAVLQFGGVSGNGYLSADEVNAGMTALQRDGDFENGVYRRRDGAEGKKNQDAFEAIWEYVNGKRVNYVTAAYDGPVMVNPADHRWLPASPGVAEKPLHHFQDRHTAIRLLQLAPDASFTVHGRGIFLVLSGTGQVDQTQARKQTAFSLEAGETAVLRANDDLTALHYALPVLAERTNAMAAE
jgi:mannose-6-phosphate isomerase-like protein (cupin superfamily)